MPAASLSLQDWDKTLQPTLGTLFNKLGIVKTWTRTLFFLSSMCYSSDVKHPHFWQCTLQVEMLVAEDSKTNPTGALMQMMTKDPWKEVGCQGFLTDVPIKILEEVATKSWVQALALFVVKARIQLQDPCPKLKLKCQKDQFLMRLFLKKDTRKKV